MTEPNESTELEVSGKQHGMMVETDRSWKPAPMATMSDTDFEYRVSIAETEVRRMGEIQKAIMKDGIDYGIVPGIGKPMLFQPGAQILNRFTGLRPSYQYDRVNGDGVTLPVIAITVECKLIDGLDREVGSGFGSANSWEVKHRYRYTERVCPACGVSAVRTSQYDEKYYCDKRKDGCGKKFKADSEAAKILDTQPSMGENPDPHDLDNTILKMSCKRAYIAATVNTHACSGQFSQEFTDEGDAGEQGDQPTNKQRSQARKSSGKKKAAAKQTREDAPDDSLTSEGQCQLLFARLSSRFNDLGYTYNDDSRHMACAEIFESIGLPKEVDGFAKVPRNKVNELLTAIEAWSYEEEGGGSDEAQS